MEMDHARISKNSLSSVAFFFFFDRGETKHQFRWKVGMFAVRNRIISMSVLMDIGHVQISWKMNLQIIESALMKFGHTGWQNFHACLGGNRAHRISEKWNFHNYSCENGACPDCGKTNLLLCFDGNRGEGISVIGGSSVGGGSFR